MKVHSLLDPEQQIGELLLVSSTVDDEFWIAADSQHNELDVLANDCGPVATTDPGNNGRDAAERRGQG